MAALIVNTDTYIALADAEIYLAANYISTDAKFYAWGCLTDADKTILLRKAAKIIDRQPLQGYKYSYTQAMAFPRYLFTEPSEDESDLHPLIRTGGWYCDGTVPADVKNAQCEIAVQLTQPASERAEMQRQGVKSFSLGSLSETYAGGQYAIESAEAKEYLAPYTGGGFRI